MWRTCWVLQPQGPSPRSASVLNCGRLPPPEFPACRGTPTLSASQARPACPSRASGWSSLTTPWGSPCFVRFPCVHAAATTPAQRLNVSLRSFHPDVSVFPDRVVGSTCALSFSRIARRSLALRPAHSRCHQFVTRNRRLQPFRYLHDCSDCFRLERLPGGICTHWKAPPLHGAHPQRTSLHRSKLTSPSFDHLVSAGKEHRRDCLKLPLFLSVWPGTS